MMNTNYKNEENAILRGGDEESSVQHIGDVDARSSTGANNENGASLPPPSAPKSRKYKYKLLTLIGVVLLIAVIALSVGLATRSKEEDSTIRNNVVGLKTEAGNEQVEMEEAPSTTDEVETTIELVDKDGNVLSSFTAEMESMAPSTMPSVQAIISSSPTMSPMQPSASPVTSPPTSNPTASPVTPYPTVTASIVSDGDDYFGFGTLFGEPEETVDDGGCYDGLAEIACCWTGWFC